jgi:tRNA threonylcarbamoyl adenosine modification protein YeaZ
LGLAWKLLCKSARKISRRGTIGTVKILAIDTSSIVGSVAFLAHGRVLAEECADSAEPSSSALFRRVNSVLERASAKLSEIDCFAVTVGPGSFTGVRVGLAAAKGWAEVWQRPIAAVSVLEAVAAQATEPGALVAALTDARRGLLFCGLYRRISSDGGAAGADAVRGPGDFDEFEKVDEEFVAPPAEILDRVLTGAAEPPLLVTPSAEAALAVVANLAGRSARIEIVSPALALVIGRIGFTRALRGQVVDALGLNANYIQRSAAEVNWKEPA